MRMKIKRTLVSALCLALCLCLCGCVAGVDALNKTSSVTLPPAQVEYDAPTGDTNQETAQSVLLYVPSAAGTRLIAQTEKIVLSAARHPAEATLRRLFAFAGNDSAQSLSPDVTLQLSTVNPVEISGDTATVNLAASALSLSHSDLYVVCQAIANTLTQWGDIRYVNVLVSSIQPGLDVGATSLVSCDLEFSSAGNKILEYRTDSDEYSRQTESLRAELMEEGNVFDETVCMLWLLRESSCFYDLFSREEQKYLTSRINELYLNSLLAKTLLSVSIHNALDSAALGLFSKKKAIFSTQLGTGVLFQVPFMERSSAVFIESEELYCNAEKRLESVIARLEENGNEVHVIRAGTVPLLQIDNLYYECIPTQHKYYRVPVFGVQLRRYIM